MPISEISDGPLHGVAERYEIGSRFFIELKSTMTNEPRLREGAGYFGPAYRHEPVETLAEPGRSIYGGALERARTELQHPLRGVTTGNSIAAGLFPLRRTGVSLVSVNSAAESFINTLDATQRRAITFGVDDDHLWRTWHNMHPNLMRHGICLFDLDAIQRDAALELVRQTMSAAGFANARNVMKLNGYVGELTGRSEEFGEWYYFLTIFGRPSDVTPWGWQLDGHHLIINCFVLGDQLVLTPQFSGSEPVLAESGPHAGTRVFAEEEPIGLHLMRSLTTEQQAVARIGMVLPRDVVAGAQADNLELPYAGIRSSQLTADQRSLLAELIGLYVGRIRPGHDTIRMDEVKAHLGETWFAWIGGHDDEKPFYYRVHSPVILIEFDHLPGVIYDNTEPTRRHIHTVVRTPNGNDYGADLLRQHYLDHDHAHAHSPHRRGER
jgi:hypothetical protein